MGKQRNDASKSSRGIVHQFYVALEEAFKLRSNQILYIERQGDVTRAGIQIEVKDYDVEDKLTDKHKNFWNTLYNWMSLSFDAKKYEKLILLTTQKIGKKSSFKNWNEKDLDQKLAILNSIKDKINETDKISKINSQILEIMKSENNDKLNDILSKFIIDNSNNESVDVIERIKTQLITIPSKNQISAINSLLGFIISPEIVIDKGWEITYNSFEDKRMEIGRLFSEGTISFPQRPTGYCHNEDFSNDLFIKKIKDIEYEEVMDDASSDFWFARQLDIEDLKTRRLTKKVFDDLELTILEEFNRKARSMKLESGDIITKSKKFYNNVTDSEPPTLGSFQRVEKYYRNGKVHELANDEDKNVRWHLGGSDE